MKTVDANQFATNLEDYLKASRTEVIVVTQAGKPCAVVHGLEYDEEQLQLADSPDFWSMIEQRRRGKTVSWDAVKASLEG